MKPRMRGKAEMEIPPEDEKVSDSKLELQERDVAAVLKGGTRAIRIVAEQCAGQLTYVILLCVTVMYAPTCCFLGTCA